MRTIPWDFHYGINFKKSRCDNFLTIDFRIELNALRFGAMLNSALFSVRCNNNNKNNSKQRMIWTNANKIRHSMKIASKSVMEKKTKKKSIRYEIHVISAMHNNDVVMHWLLILLLFYSFVLWNDCRQKKRKKKSRNQLLLMGCLMKWHFDDAVFIHDFYTSLQVQNESHYLFRCYCCRCRCLSSSGRCCLHQWSHSTSTKLTFDSTKCTNPKCG